jgi:phage baseplate assembly protein gpV
MCLINKFEINGVRIDDSFKKRPEWVPVNDQNDPQYLEGYSVMDCSLTKELLKPNVFSFTMRHQKAQGKSFAIIDNLMGKSVTCQVYTLFEGNSNSSVVFSGTIAKVGVKGAVVSCIAYSEDAKLQGSPKCRCFCGKKLSEIVDAVVKDDVYHIKKTISIHSSFDTLTLPYIVQYNESDYDFLVRLAKRFGAFFYYDQDGVIKRLYFGIIPGSNQVDFDLSGTPNAKSVSYELMAVNPNFRYMSYFDEKDKYLQTAVPDLGGLGSTGLMGKAVAGSRPLVANYAHFVDEPNRLPKTPNNDMLKLFSEAALRSMSDSMVTCTFISYRFDIHVGSVVKIDSNDPMLVTAVHLTWDCNGSPQNEVTAVVLPKTDFVKDKLFAPYMDPYAYPKSSALRAVVVNNIDEKKMGRVQVRFAWQPADMANDEKQLLPWIRIAQPYGGGKKDKEQGCYILPEIGEEVMVGFEHDNLEKPYVIGALYHDSDTADNVQMPDPAWVETDQANKNNEVKAFRTKKGHTIEFHDVDGNDNYGFIRIYGKNQSEKNYDIYLSSNPVKNGDAFYKVNGPKEDAEAKKEIGLQEYEAKELRILVRSNGGDIVLDAGDGDIIMNAKNIRVNVAGNRTTAIQDDDIVSIGGNRLVDAGNDSLMLRGKQTVMVHGELDAEYKAAVNLVADRDLKADVKRTMKLMASDLEAEASQTAKVKTNSGIELNGGMKVDIQATNFKAEGRADATLKGTDITVDALVAATIKATDITLDSEAGTRKGLWTDM